MAQPGTLVGQINSGQQQQNASLTQVQPQTIVSNGLVQTSVGMAVQQQQGLAHATSMQTVSGNNLNSPQLTLQSAQGTVGLIAGPVPGSVLPLQPQTTLVAHVKSEDDKGQAIAPPASVVSPFLYFFTETFDTKSTNGTVFLQDRSIVHFLKVDIKPLAVQSL
ncbi:unnamed protein product [Diatraea saccharalis]|uniref:Uncharacterized protein n=1 Tax=Diatraea saccharalis TaxID=40085 RepID=A0A9N9N0N8_9NEOP|nr:unnamed protein product [Diatraea saccharalis]